MAKPKKATRAQVGLRVPEDLRERVENAAKVSGRSLNAEILERLEQSFQTEERFGGPILIHLIATIALVMRNTGQMCAHFETGEIMTSDRWLDMPFPYERAKGAVIGFLESFRPPGKVVVPKQSAAEELAWRKAYKDNPKIQMINIKEAGYMMREIFLDTHSSPKEEQDNE